MSRKKIVLVVGARPNFMKIAPIMRQLRKYRQFMPVLVHTGQHYDRFMSKVFFDDLKIARPYINLNVGSGSHAAQTAEIMKRFERFLIREGADLVLVVGDVNSTLACSLVASKLHIKIAHVEAGLRSFDRTMPEEINRIVTDGISDFLFTTCKDANVNLLREGIDKRKIYFVGNVMIDSLLTAKIEAKDIKFKNLNLQKFEYAVLTLHRPSNVDERKAFLNILRALKEISKKVQIVFPCHPRTMKQIRDFNFKKFFKNIKIVNPLGYLEFVKLISGAKFILTDSGGIQEEATILNIPCLTLRKNTERPVTVKHGTNIIVGTDTRRIIKESFKIIDGIRKKSKPIPYWDGKAAERIVKILKRQLR